MNDFYTFFITSNINTKHTKIPLDQRFMQTIDTIVSIRERCPGAKILLADNSSTPLTKTQKDIIVSMIDHYVDYRNNLFTDWINVSGTNKGINELFVYSSMLDAATDMGLIGKRIFKISGRYQLDTIFDPNEYDKLKYHGKYVFAKTFWLINHTRPVGTGEGDITVLFYNTALWSMCSTLVDNYRNLLPKLFSYMMIKGENLEITHRELIPKDSLELVDRVGGCGYITNGEWTYF